MPRPLSDDVPEPGLVAAHAAAQDALLVERVLRGDTAAYGDLVTRHMRRAFALAYRVLDHREDAEDAVQESFIRALEKLDTLQRNRPFQPWFFRIVMNQALNHRRARRVRTTEMIPEMTAARTPSPDAETERSALRDRLTLALDALPAKQRTIVQLAELEEFTSAEIAELLDMADGTVRWHLHQARRKLRQSLAELKEA